VPGSGRTLLAYLEGSVFEAAAPREGGLFHPKLWLLRFVSDAEPVRYRLLCLTRNLTFDHSWDTALVLDGKLEDRRVAFASNHPLGDFVAALPDLAVRPLPVETREVVSTVSSEVRKVRFELPEGFENLEFWPLGIDGHRRWPFPDSQPGRRMLVVSPFLGARMLARLADGRSKGVLISRPECLAEIGAEALSAFEEIYVLSPEADPEDTDEGEAPPPDGTAARASMGDGWTGLHAKLYVMDDGWDARIWTGSANATDAAFSVNVEFLAELVGKKASCGIDAILGDASGVDSSLRALLSPFVGSRREVDPALELLEKALERVRTTIGSIQWSARITQVEGGLYSLELRAEGSWPTLPAGLTVTCRPVTLGPATAVPMARGADPHAIFGPLTFEALTSFFAFEVSLRQGTCEDTARFVVNAPLERAPADRRERLLRTLLSDANQVLRLIWLLLSEDELGVQEWVEAARRSQAGSEAWRDAEAAGFPILETMLKALGRDPAKLDEVGRLVADLRRTPEGAALLPPGFDAIWEPIWKTREELR
jgi:hypothetical protein